MFLIRRLWFNNRSSAAFRTSYCLERLCADLEGLWKTLSLNKAVWLVIKREKENVKIYLLCSLAILTCRGKGWCYIKTDCSRKFESRGINGVKNCHCNFFIFHCQTTLDLEKVSVYESCALLQGRWKKKRFSWQRSTRPSKFTLAM